MSIKKMIRLQNDLALGLTGRILFQAKSKNTNFIFSPLSIHILLNLITTGSSGATRHQLLSLLRSTTVDSLISFTSRVVNPVLADGTPNGGPRLNIANGLWLDTSLPLKPSFKQVVGNVYKAACNVADFQNNPEQVVRDVNSWCKKETHGLIKEILNTSLVNRSTILILANALYFKGAWEKKFNKSKTKDDNFHLSNGRSVKVPFMTSMKSHQMASCHDGFKVLGLPYEQGLDERRLFTMYFFLPAAKDGLPALIQKMSSEPRFLDRYLPSRFVKVNLKIPRFKIESEFDASDILKELGFVAPFHGGLTEMVDPPLGDSLSVDKVFHKAFIEVNEEGTEAAAATAMLGRKASLGFVSKEEIIDFVADHPFLYLIREDETGVVMFVGHVLNPQEPR